MPPRTESVLCSSTYGHSMPPPMEPQAALHQPPLAPCTNSPYSTSSGHSMSPRTNSP
eukprot:CAMPEP_0174375976 /NCGR_PEP_ID=MMETSP0811_2-20130205/116554_1 /TAXON_ID=73025 ORGANISM="Eutreptiella gymnastica-like, Strain CCMP1594" /NCGR_SAMPLE_ID=MMETSP0811_2 /ASSEMBLY_ACC=CAM_ASM_000667 /LENGTH=56 /DNA_ID=CAMNT_0015526737 /DNA_START=9 /DNA_END=175 /DNA_ORIENTATION=-